MNVITDHRIFRSMALVFLLCSNYVLHAQVMDTTIVEGLEKPGFVESDLNNSLAKKESLFKGFLAPENYNEWKTNLYHETKFKFSASYQASIMHASNTLAEPDHAAAGSVLLEGEWTPLNYDKDFQGAQQHCPQRRHERHPSRRVLPHSPDPRHVERSKFLRILYTSCVADPRFHFY